MSERLLKQFAKLCCKVYEFKSHSFLIMFNFHLEESKYRILMGLSSITWVTIVIILFLPDLIQLFNYNLISFSLEATIIDIFYLALIYGTTLNIPFLITQSYLFFKSSLFKVEGFVFKIILLWILLVWTLGSIFMPYAINYLMDFNNEIILFLPSITNLISLMNQVFILLILIGLTPLLVYSNRKRKVIWTILNLVGIIILDFPIHILLVLQMLFVLEFSFLFKNLMKILL